MVSLKVEDAAKDAGLCYVTNSMPGITRSRRGSAFVYRQPNGTPVKDPQVLDRIRALAIPPAYTNVWICPDPRGHLQATGIDARGRKQYRYHPCFREVRDQSKFERMVAFGQVLPSIRKQIDRDLAVHGLPKRKVLASVVYLLEHSLIRVGNEEYARQNHSYGLTTMLTRHVKISGQRIEFTFLGKSNTQHRIELHDRRLAQIVRKIQELPGQELFHYLDEEATAHTISSADVNAYLFEAAGDHFTAKDFRTWWGSLLAFTDFSHREPPSAVAAAKHIVKEVMVCVADHLGNTPAICRKCYVNPKIVEAFETGKLAAFPAVEVETTQLLHQAETELLKFLERA